MATAAEGSAAANFPLNIGGDAAKDEIATKTTKTTKTNR
jgi:hypothetical protein